MNADIFVKAAERVAESSRADYYSCIALAYHNEERAAYANTFAPAGRDPNSAWLHNQPGLELPADRQAFRLTALLLAAEMARTGDLG